MNTLNIHQRASTRTEKKQRKVNFIHTKEVKRMRGLRNSIRAVCSTAGLGFHRGDKQINCYLATLTKAVSFDRAL